MFCKMCQADVEKMIIMMHMHSTMRSLWDFQSSVHDDQPCSDFDIFLSSSVHCSLNSSDSLQQGMLLFRALYLVEALGFLKLLLQGLKCKVVHLSRCLICLQWVIFIQLCGIAKVCCNLQWVLSTKHYGFPYPITLTMIHMAFSGSVAFILVRVFKVSSPFPLVPAFIEDFTAM
jgi:hypothetical protein